MGLPDGLLPDPPQSEQTTGSQLWDSSRDQPQPCCQCTFNLGVNTLTASTEVPKQDPLIQKLKVLMPHIFDP
jgi:hypothetical protein